MPISVEFYFQALHVTYDPEGEREMGPRLKLAFYLTVTQTDL